MAVEVGNSRRAQSLLVTCIVVPILTTLFILVRTWSRVFILHYIGWDDYTAIITLFFCITYNVMIGLSTNRSIVPDEQPAYVKWINDADFIYLVSLLGYKMSILVVYLRVFAVNKRFRYVTWAMMFFVCGYLLSNLWTQLFGCSPRSKYWLPDTPGHCINYTKAGLAYGSMNIASDLLIFILPLPIIWHLQLPLKERLGVSLIFMSGVITCSAAIVRYVIIVRENEADAKYFIWSTMEIHVGVWCSCMPAFKPLLAHVLPKLNVSRIYLPRLSKSRSAHQGTRLKSPTALGFDDGEQAIELRESSKERDQHRQKDSSPSQIEFGRDGMMWNEHNV